MRNRFAGLVIGVLLAAGCAPGGGDSSMPAQTPGATALGKFSVPANITRAIPPPPPQRIPPKPSSSRRATSSTGHPAFFSGEAALNNGVYYLALPNGTPFGYYSYLQDPNYIYHFDMGYEYMIDANDGVGGIYFYDFASSHWWYTGRQYPFPYIYDFGLGTGTLVYYYADTNNAGHYTTNPRYFYDFPKGEIITLPLSFVFAADPLYLSGTTAPCTDATPAPGGSSATKCYPVTGGGGGSSTVELPFNESGGASPPYSISERDAGIISASATANGSPPPTGNVFVTPLTNGRTVAYVSASNGGYDTFGVVVTQLNLAITLNNMLAARSIIVTPTFGASGVYYPTQTLTLPGAPAASFTYNLVNFPVYLGYYDSSNPPSSLPPISTTRLVSLNVQITDGANTIGNKTMAEHVPDGSATSQTITFP